MDTSDIHCKICTQTHLWSRTLLSSCTTAGINWLTLTCCVSAEHWRDGADIASSYLDPSKVLNYQKLNIWWLFSLFYWQHYVMTILGLNIAYSSSNKLQTHYLCSTAIFCWPSQSKFWTGLLMLSMFCIFTSFYIVDMYKSYCQSNASCQK